MAMSAGMPEEGEPMSEINTTPLIDVMLVLLIMLIITIPPQTHAVKLDMPAPNSPPPLVAPPPPITIDVDFDGTIYWAGQVVDKAQMEAYMSQLAAQPFDSQSEIHIRPHKRAKYGAVAGVMASAQRLGLSKMGVIGGTK
jgi:biopolymer transport protein ExbD